MTPKQFLEICSIILEDDSHSVEEKTAELLKFAKRMISEATQ